MDNTKKRRKKLLLARLNVIFLLGGFAISTSLVQVPETAGQTSSILPSAPGSFSQLVKEVRQSVVKEVIESVERTLKQGKKPMSSEKLHRLIALK